MSNNRTPFEAIMLQMMIAVLSNVEHPVFDRKNGDEVRHKARCQRLWDNLGGSAFD